MVNYKELYSILFNKMTDIIEEIQQTQRLTEEIYLNSKDSEFVLLKPVRIQTAQGKQK